MPVRPLPLTGATLAQLPSVDRVLRSASVKGLVAVHGHTAVVAMLRSLLEQVRSGAADAPTPTATELADHCAQRLTAAARPRLRPVFNLTGTVLHTNLGRALLPEEAIAAVAQAMRMPSNLEFDLDTGGRGDRDDLVEGLLRELTGAQACTIVNNNAAAVFLTLNTLAQRKQVIVSRGELIEIGGAFRMPDIMARAGVRLVEVGTTNRTHLRDYEGAIGAATGCVMKVHTSNYLIQGFTKEVSGRELSALARSKAIPLVDDLGSGTLVDLTKYGLRRERTVQEAVAGGADLVLFSGDKLLGGPQAGFIVGRRDLVRACAKNPMKRAVRLDKIRLAALEATLRLYLNPDTVAHRLPTLAMLTAPKASLEEMAQRLVAPVQAAAGGALQVSVCACASQIGSGALPLESIPSAGLAIAPTSKKSAGRHLTLTSKALRALPIPVIARIADDTLIMDMRTLDDERAFLQQLPELKIELAGQTG